jgi:hypothetical protein
MTRCLIKYRDEFILPLEARHYSNGCVALKVNMALFVMVTIRSTVRPYVYAYVVLKHWHLPRACLQECQSVHVHSYPISWHSWKDFSLILHNFRAPHTCESNVIKLKICDSCVSCVCSAFRSVRLWICSTFVQVCCSAENPWSLDMNHMALE